MKISLCCDCKYAAFSNGETLCRNKSFARIDFVRGSHKIIPLAQSAREDKRACGPEAKKFKSRWY